jgi:hypothetical protein
MDAKIKTILFFIGVGGVTVLLWWWMPVGEVQTTVHESTREEVQPTEQTSTNQVATNSEQSAEQSSDSGSDVSDSMTKPSSRATNTPRILVQQVVGEVVQLEVVAVRSQNDDTSCNPVAYGEVQWGNGQSETVYGKGCGEAKQTLDISHAYEEYGEYAITFTNEREVEATTQALVGGELVNQPRMEVSVDGQTATVVVRGVTDTSGPAAVDGPIVFGDLLWGDGSTTRVSELSGEPAKSSHQYRESGTYTIALEVAGSDAVLKDTITIE